MKQAPTDKNFDSLVKEITRGLLLGAMLILVTMITARPIISNYAPPSMEHALFNAMSIAIIFILTIRAFLSRQIIIPSRRLATALLLMLLLAAISFRTDSCTWLIENELLNWAVTIGIFFATWNMVSDIQYGRIIRRILVAAIIASCLTVLLQALWQYFIFLEPLLAKVRQSALTAKQMASPVFTKRVNTIAARGVFEHSNALAGFIILIAPLFWGFLIYAHSIKFRIGIIIGWICTALSILALFTTHSAGGNIGLIAGGGVFIFLYLYKKCIAPLFENLLTTKRAKVIASISLAVISIITFAGLWSFCMRHPSFVLRVEYWKAAASMILERPLGVGLGNFGEHYYNHITVSGWQTRHAHNVYLSLMAELGIFSIFVFGALIVGYIKTAQKDSDNSSQQDSIGQVQKIARIFAVFGGLLGMFLIFATETWPLDMGWWILIPTLICWIGLFLFLTHFEIKYGIIKIAVIAGISAMLLHGTAEFLFRIHPLMLSAAVLAALIGTPKNSYVISLKKAANAVPLSLGIILFIVIVGVRGVARTTVLAAVANTAQLSLDDALMMEAEAKKNKDVSMIKDAHRRALDSWKHRVSYLKKINADEQAAYILAQTDDIIKRLGGKRKGSAARQYELENIFDKLIETRPSSFRARVLMGNLQMRLSHYTVASSHYQEAVKRYEVNPDIRKLLADAQIRFEPLNAIVTYNATFELNRNVDDVRTSIFQHFWIPPVRRSSVSLLTALSRARIEHGDTPALLLREGLFRTTGADFEGGAKVFEEALALGPDDAQVLAFLWYALLMQHEASKLKEPKSAATVELQKKCEDTHKKLKSMVDAQTQIPSSKSISKSVLKMLENNMERVKQVARGE